jgi:hypothetical protein
MMTVSRLDGDKAVVGQIMELASDEDDPALSPSLEEFWIKARRYGTTPGAVGPPMTINVGNHLLVEPSDCFLWCDMRHPIPVAAVAAKN